MRRLRRRRARRGMTLVEVIVALVIVSGVLISTAEFMRKFSKANAAATMLNTASDLATTRLERVKNERKYATVDTLAGTESTNLVPGDTRWTRTTTVTRTLSTTRDYKTITVTVNHPNLRSPVTKTTAIASR